MMNQMKGMGNGNNNQNMINNYQNGNNKNNNFQNNNNNNNQNYMRIKHMPNQVDDDFYECIIENISPIFNSNEINEIKTIVETEYASFLQYTLEDNYLSDLISEKIKDKFEGEWLVLVSNANDNLTFSISNYSNSETLMLRLGNTRIQIAKIK